MNNYKFSFIGRQNGAIGVRYGITDEYTANSLGEAMHMVYTDYDVNHPFDVKENNIKIPYEEAKDTKFIDNGYKGKGAARK